MSISLRAPNSRPTRRSVLSALAIASAAVLAVQGCTSGGAGPLDAAAAAAGVGTSLAGSGSPTGTPIGQSGSSGSAVAAGAGGRTSVGGSGSSAASGAGSVAGSGNTNSGGMNSGPSGGMNSGGSAGSAPKACVDVEPPPDPKWPGATCANWATETTECTAAWFATYCDVSCGRCVPPNSGTGGGTGSAGGPAAVDCSTMGLPQVTSGNGYATRYWDCCQTHCGQSDGHRCNQDGTTRTGSTQSACSGGSSFACYDEAPKAVNDCLSYGYIAKANPNCGGCYRIQFTGEGQYNANDPGSKLIKGKQMIVKVSNTGGDVANNQFDLMIPGGGVGKFDACSKEWGTSDLGAQYGGFLTNCTGTLAAKKECVRTACMKIPSGAARDGCIWFVDWFQAADNPKFTSAQTDCPF